MGLEVDTSFSIYTDMSSHFDTTCCFSWRDNLACHFQKIVIITSTVSSNVHGFE